MCFLYFMAFEGSCYRTMLNFVSLGLLTWSCNFSPWVHLCTVLDLLFAYIEPTIQLCDETNLVMGYPTITMLMKSWIQFARNSLRILILVFTAIWNWYIAFIFLSFSGFECRVILTLQSVFRVCLLLLLWEAVWGMLVINSLKVWMKWYLG